MRYIILLVVFLSCSEETLKKQCNSYCFKMTISDSTPIQFWVNGQETFNQSNPICGLTPECFCIPFDCNDEITIQFNDNFGWDYTLDILDYNGDVLTTLEFEEVYDNTFQVTFIPNELSPGICQKVQFRIIGTLAYNEEFTTTLGEYSNFGSGQLWEWANTTGTGVASTANGGASSTMYLRREIDFLPNDEINIQSRSIELEAGLFSNPTEFEIYLFDDSAPTLIHEEIYTTSGVKTLDIDEVSGGAYTHIGFRVVTTNGGYTVRVDNFDVTIRRILAQSDCIDLRSNHHCTKLIEYTNSSDFDGIKYEISPQPTFYLRVPAQLWKEDNPQTQEDLELSNGVIVTLRQTIQEKTLLELGYMPPYMHKKVQKILMHDTVIIDGIQWKRRDPYESESLKDYPLKTANVLLTKYNSVLKNTI